MNSNSVLVYFQFNEDNRCKNFLIFCELLLAIILKVIILKDNLATCLHGPT